MFIALLSFSRSLASIVNASDNIKCIFLNNQECMTQPTLINFYPNKYIQGPFYYSLAINLERSMGNCNTVNDLSNRDYVKKKTDLNLNVFNMITRKKNYHANVNIHLTIKM